MNKKLLCMLLSVVFVISLAIGVSASEETTYIQVLDQDVDGMTIDEDKVLDLNGYNVTNAIVAAGATLQLMDSANDTYDASKCGSFSGTVNGTVQQLVQQNDKSYLVIEKDGIYSAHRFYAGITHISLVPGSVALGYKAQYYADDVINPMVTGYGYAMWINSYNPVSYVKEGFISDNELTLRVKNILRDGNEELNAVGASATIGGKAVIRFNVNGAELTVEGAEYKTSLQQAVEAVNASLGEDRNAYSQEKLQAVREMYNAYVAYMTDWNVQYIYAQDKFAPVENVSVTYGDALTLGQVFTAIDGATIGDVAVTVNGESIAVAENWADTVLNLNAGKHAVTITDNDRCWTVANTVVVAKADPEVPTVGTLTATYGDTLADVDLPDGFAWADNTASVGNAGINSFAAVYTPADTANYNTVDVTVSVDVAKADSTCTAPVANKQTYNGQAQALVSAGTATGGKLVYKVEGGEYGEAIPTATAAGTYTVYYKVEATDNYNGIAEKSLIVTIEQATPNVSAPTDLTATEGQTLADVILPGGFSWKDATLDVGTAGTNTFTVIYTPTDANYKTVEFTVTVVVKEVEFVNKFAIALYDGEPAFLYRVGNINAVALSSLFKKLDSVEIGTVSIEVVTLSGDAAGTYTANNTWTDGTIKFTGTGVVEVIICDETSKPCSIKLEVITARNITKAESATANNVVLLNDTSGTFVVSGGYTFYGNGFTVKLPTTSVKNVGNGFTGYISLGGVNDDGSGNGGNLDNVRIEGPVYPEMYIYRDQAKITDKNDPDYGDGFNMRYFVNSVIVYGGNSTISNCYISGSRTALCLRGGNNVVIENTTLFGGAYANMQICAGSSVTLRDVTTIQVDVADSYGQGKTAHGMGIAVDSDVVDIYIEGELNQYNWLNQSKWNSIVPSTYQSAFPKFFTESNFSKHWHYLNGDTAPYVNMGFIFACNWDTSKIHDNRATVNYGTTSATIAGVSGGVYTKLNTVGGNAITDADLTGPAYVPTGFNPVAPVLNFDNSPNADADDASDANDTYCVYNESTGTLKIGISGSSKTLDLSKVTVEKNGTALAHTVYLNGTAVTGNSVTIETAYGAKQTLIIKATSNDAGFDKDGNAIAGSIEYTWTVTVEVATLSYPAPVWNMGGNYQFDKTNLYYVYYSTSQGYGEAVPIYEGIKIDYYDKNGKLVQKNFSGTTTHPTGSNNSNSNAFTLTLNDGSTLVMKYSSGWKSGATTHQFATYSNKVYVYPQSLDNDNYVRAKTTNQDFDVKITYTFTDPNGQSISQTMRWYNAMSSNGSVSTVQWKTFDTANGKKPSICVTPETLVTLADGSQKEIQYVTYEDKLLAWNMYTGEYQAVPAAYLIYHGDAIYTVITLNFSDGSTVNIIGEHGFYDVTTNQYEFIDAENVASYVGHRFAAQDGIGHRFVELLSYSVQDEYTGSYSAATVGCHNFITNGLISLTPAGGFEDSKRFFNFLEMGDGLKYDEEALQKDIETYGLFTYDELAAYLTEEEYASFVAMNGHYYKIGIGKGLYTLEELLGTIGHEDVVSANR